MYATCFYNKAITGIAKFGRTMNLLRDEGAWRQLYLFFLSFTVQKFWLIYSRMGVVG